MVQPFSTPLPVDPLLPRIVESLERHPSAVVVAEPGAGKTTRVPPALLAAPFAKDKEIWVLQPRRLAAKMAALRVAEECGEEPGQSVGYRFRFEKRLSARTRLCFMTDGMLLPLALSDPTLSNVAAVVLDEFHERSLALELGLAFLRRLQSGPRPDLRLLVMSATLDAQALSAYLDGCPVFQSEGRVFPVRVEYHPFPQEPSLESKVRSALGRLASEKTQGTTLVFLPGLGEIRKCQRALEKGPFEVRALYGDLPVEEQQRVLRPSPGNPVILCTNVAETSLTVPGVTAVVDSGLTRQARLSAWSGLTRLVTVPSSRASAAQRTGRAGRLREGACFRLFSKYDFEHRAAFDVPEILRSDLSKSLLDLKQLGVEDLEAFPWLMRPSAASLEASLALLARLGALDGKGGLTEAGRWMARFPLAPRLAKMLLEARERNPQILSQACRLAVLINEERAESPDLLEELQKYKPGYESQKLEGQLQELTARTASRPSPPGGQGLSTHDRMAQCLLAAFPDRVAKVRPAAASFAHAPGTGGKGGRQREFVLCGGGSALGPDNALTRSHEYFVVVEAQELEQNARAQALVRSLAPIEIDWLLDLFPGELREETTCQWNGKAGRVEGSKRLLYGQLALDEKALAPRDFGPEAEELLYREALAAGPAAYCDPEELESFRNRVRFAAERDGAVPPLSEETLEETLREMCQGCRGFSDLKQAGLVAALQARLFPRGQALLERLAPASVALPSGRRLAIHYEPGKPPWGRSRVQDFFGMKQGPAVGGVPVVLHLLSPAQRPVQVTSDLAGFWQNHYPQTRRELSRRYPRHRWPENPV